MIRGGHRSDLRFTRHAPDYNSWNNTYPIEEIEVNPQASNRRHKYNYFADHEMIESEKDFDFIYNETE